MTAPELIIELKQLVNQLDTVTNLDAVAQKIQDAAFYLRDSLEEPAVENTDPFPISSFEFTPTKKKMTIETATQVREDAAKTDFSKRGSKGEFDAKWAEALSVSTSTITNIRLGKTWNL